MTRRKKTKGYSAPPLSAHEAGKITAHDSSQPSSAAQSLRYDPDEDPIASLTTRETEVLVDIADGYNNQEIARRKDVAVATIEKHVENIFPKLDVRTRADAAIWFLKRAIEKRDRALAELHRRVKELELRLAAHGG